jgi:hypothetical protein
MRPFRSTRQAAGLEPNDWPSSAEAAVGPAVLVHNLGKGTVLTFAGSPDFSTASEHAITETRKLFAEAVRFLNPSPQVRVTAPANVESVVTEDTATRTIRIHFIAYNSLPQTMPASNRPYVIPGLAEEAPIFRITVTTKQAITSVKAWNKSTVLSHTGNIVHATINDIHEILAIHY